jgi:hypothetical protein
MKTYRLQPTLVFLLPIMAATTVAIGPAGRSGVAPGAQRAVHLPSPAVVHDETRDAPRPPVWRTPRGGGIPHCGPWVQGQYQSIQVNVDNLGCNIVGDAANEPSIAVDPTARNKIVIGWRHFDTVHWDLPLAGWAYSHDAGRTWLFPGVLQPDISRSNPVLDAGPNGEIYFYSSRWSWCDLFKSFDGGVSWVPPVYAFGGFIPWMTVDRTTGLGRGNIYAYDPSGGNPPFARSTDDGKTFEGFDCYGPAYGTMTVGPNGEVYIAGWGHLVKSDNAWDPDAVPVFSWWFGVDLCPDGVMSVVPDPKDRPYGFDEPNPGGLLNLDWVATDHSDGPNRGNVYFLGGVSCSDEDPLDIMFARSTDGGLTWSEPVRINDDPPGNWQWFGMMSVAPNGRIDVVWNDNRTAGQPNLSELYYACSTDAGLTWSENIPVSPVFDSWVGWAWGQTNIGDYYDMVSDDLGANIAYAATFNEEQDVYFLRIGSYDCNANGIPDEDDIACGSSEDCDANNIPDECDPDCNGNGAPDACDIADGIAHDEDGNGIPDECEDVILFVDGAATGANDGSSWEDAYNDLQDAITHAQASRGLVTEIWVATGTYKPDRGTGNPVGSFRLVSGVGIYGGFSGVETVRKQRDPTGNPTVLSGDLNGDDDAREPGGHSDCCEEHPTPGCSNPVCEAAVCEYHPDCCESEWDWRCSDSAEILCCTVCSDRPTRCDNSRHVIAASGNDPTAVLDGFTVTGGIADQRSWLAPVSAGGGLWNMGGSPTIINCTFVHNSGFYGGASYNLGGTPTFMDCTFSNNSAVEGGGGVSIAQGELRSVNRNTEMRDSGEGPLLINCHFIDNSAYFVGGGIHCDDSVRLEGCTFVGNSTSVDGGGMYSEGSPTLDDCTFIGNQARDGGGLYTGPGSPTLNACTFTGNSAGDGGGLYTGYASSPTLSDCTFTGNSAGDGGGAYTGYAGSPTLNDCTFSGNSADSRGGGLHNSIGSPTLKDCVFSGNSADRGGAMSNHASEPTLLNCTLTSNYAQSSGGALYSRQGSAPWLSSSILWGNMDSSGTGESAQIYNYNALGVNNPVVRYSCIQGLTGALGGVGNIGDDPLFVDPEGPDGIPGTEDDDLRLTPSSPGVNTGDPAFILEPGETDLAGQPRLQGCRVDMGAYETDVLQSPGDFDSDLDFDLADFAYLQVCFRAGEGDPLWLDACLCGFDFDGNDAVDIADFAAFVQDFDGPH